MFKKSLLVVSLIATVSAFAMDPNKNPFNAQFNKTNDLYNRVQSNNSVSSFKGSDGNYYYSQGGQTYSSQSWSEKNRRAQENQYRSNSSYQNDCTIF